MEQGQDQGSGAERLVAVIHEDRYAQSHQDKVTIEKTSQNLSEGQEGNWLRINGKVTRGKTGPRSVCIV